MPNLLYILCLTTLFFTTSSCIKKSGCTDVEAANYDKEAEEDCCCEYKGSVVLWFDKYTSKEMSNLGSTNLYYYMDDKYVATTTVTALWDSIPYCGQNGAVTLFKNFSPYKSSSASFYVNDQNGRRYFQRSISFENNDCEAIELKW